MRGDGFRLIAFFVLTSLLPVYSSAVIEEKSSIVGVVVGASEKPLSNITVRLLDSFFLVEIAKAVTDRNGKFLLPDLLPGLYLVSVDLPSLSGMFKRVQVVSGTPTFIDLRSVLREDQLKDHDAWDRFKWTIRIAERNPLRKSEKDIAQSSVRRFGSEDILSVLAMTKGHRVRAEVAYLSVGVLPSDESWSQQTTRFGMEGELRGAGSWSVNGHVVGGERFNYAASGDFRYRLFGHNVGASFSANDLLFARYPEFLERELISRFLRTGFSRQVTDQDKLWVTSVHVEDEWQLLRQIRIDYGTRIDYYGYLEEPVKYSPRLEFSYQMTPKFAVRTSYHRNQSAPGNFNLHEEDFHPVVPIAFVPYSDRLDPETREGYEAGVDYTNNDLRLSVSCYTEKVNDKIATIDVRSSGITQHLDTNLPFVIFNADDLHSRGIEVEVEKRISQDISAVGAYNVKQSVPVYILEKRNFADRRLFFKDGDALEEYHDFRAGLEAKLHRTSTQVNADWNWSSGSPLIFGRTASGSLSSVDLHVSQGVPMYLISDAELKLMLAVRNVLDQSPVVNSNADFHRTLLFAMPRSISGGVLVKF